MSGHPKCQGVRRKNLCLARQSAAHLLSDDETLMMGGRGTPASRKPKPRCPFL